MEIIKNCFFNSECFSKTGTEIPFSLNEMVMTNGNRAIPLVSSPAVYVICKIWILNGELVPLLSINQELTPPRPKKVQQLSTPPLNSTRKIKKTQNRFQ
ncbi:hypothetical protein TNCT_359851 [Trichonephila clavata]|uniref:Uncharacterized protein n=1 Tax=Trichonephila clavata TaxID=2740835 RepID=A0A8X6FU13_TRICU|nr:hypothetical protein TNCT_359851 [Trichonephila clavata]